MTKVGIIGAGAAGLCAARHIKKISSVSSIKIFESQNSVGGTWVYTDSTNTPSSMYKSLVTNLPDRCMQFPDYDFHTLQNKARFVGHEEVLNYLKGYCKKFSIEKFIQFETRVERVYRKDDKWYVESKTKNGKVESDDFDKLMERVR